MTSAEEEEDTTRPLFFKGVNWAQMKVLKKKGSFYMNTASKLGPHTQTDRGTCPGVGL